jgi:GT2 family glycosyltransferase
MTKATIIIVTHNSAAVISDCLKSFDKGKYDLIIIDNKSTDNSVALVKKVAPKAMIIKAKTNLGYGRANNLAIEQSKTPYSIILNPDTRMKPADINKVLKVMDNNKDIAIAAPQISDKTYKKNKAQISFVDWVSGAAFFVRNDIFQKLGGFDDNIFLFFEETDLCKRAIDNGYKIALVNNAIAIHQEGQSSPQSAKYIFVKNWHFMWSHTYFYKKRKEYHNLCLAPLNVLRLTCRVIFAAICFNKYKFFKYSGRLCGLVAFILGFNAFDKNNNPRAI